MKTNNLYSTTLFIMLGLTSCNKADDKISLSNDYLPLATGNFWQLENSEKKEITGTRVIDNETWFIMASPSDTSYYRIENNKIFVKEFGGDAAIKFDLDAQVGEIIDYNEWNVTLGSKTDIIEIAGTRLIASIRITNCYRFDFDYPVMVDDEHSIWLAPGIGFIQEVCGECQYPLRKLDKARIGDRELWEEF